MKRAASGLGSAAEAANTAAQPADHHRSPESPKWVGLGSEEGRPSTAHTTTLVEACNSLADLRQAAEMEE